MKGEVKLPLSFTMRLDPVEADFVRRLVRVRGHRTPQNTIIGILREWDDLLNKTPERSAEDLNYRRMYFDLVESTGELREQTKKLLGMLDQASEERGESAEKSKSKKKDKKKRRKP